MITPEFTPELAQEMLDKYGDLNEKQLMDKLIISLLESNPDKMQEMMAELGHPVEDMADFTQYVKDNEGTFDD